MTPCTVPGRLTPARRDSGFAEIGLVPHYRAHLDVQAWIAYDVGMADLHHAKIAQLTVRGVPLHVKSALCKRARSEGKSLNTVLVETLSAAAGAATPTGRFTDLDHLAGAWVEDAECEAALRAQDQVDESLWQ